VVVVVAGGIADRLPYIDVYKRWLRPTARSKSFSGKIQVGKKQKARY
jgi:hypothetical protein